MKMKHAVKQYLRSIFEELDTVRCAFGASKPQR